MNNSNLRINLTGNSFVDQLSLYQAANADNQSVKKNFVIRTVEFDIIISDLKNKKTLDPLQHELILGRRGSGKSTLLRRIQAEIEEDDKLSQNYIAINLAEEQASIYRLHDLWMEVWKELLIKTDNNLILKNFDEFETEIEYTRYLYADINKLLSKEKKKIVLLLDNFDRVVSNFTDDGHLLREVLLNYKNLQIIAGSTRMDEHFWEYDKPFYEFFRRHRLESLSINEIIVLLNHWSKTMKLPQLSQFAKNNIGKIEAVRILTDGLPRTLQFFIQILLEDSTLYGYDYLRIIMDNITPLYQERLNSLTPQQRKIVAGMAFIWEACSVSELVDECRIESKLISAQLKYLSNAGIVDVIATSKKNHLYRISERFFNMWIIITQGNPEQKRKARWLTLFLESWYDADELQALATEHLIKLKKKSIGVDKAIILAKAFAQSKHITTNQRDEILELTSSMGEEKIDCYYLGGLPKQYKIIKNKVLELINNNKFKEARIYADDIENEIDGFKFVLQGLVFHKEFNYLPAQEKYLQAIKIGHIGALNNLGILYKEMGQYKAAEQKYIEAIEQNNIEALYNLANLYALLDKKNESEVFYLKAVEKGHIGALNSLAKLYKKLKRYEESEVFYLKAIEKGHVGALYNLTTFYFRLNVNKTAALELINKFEEIKSGENAIQLKLLMEVWNNQVFDLEMKIENILEISKYERLYFFLIALLYLEQTRIVYNFFIHPKHGSELQKRYRPQYFALLLLLKNPDLNILLRIPPEIKSTVNDIVVSVKKWQQFYRDT